MVFPRACWQCDATTGGLAERSCAIRGDNRVLMSLNHTVSTADFTDGADARLRHFVTLTHPRHPRLNRLVLFGCLVVAFARAEPAYTFTPYVSPDGVKLEASGLAQLPD